MNSSYIIFFRRFLIISICLILVDKSVGRLLEHFFLKIKTGQTSRITYAVRDAHEDILLLGSSRANHHYIPAIFEDSFGRTAYNAGVDAQSILFHYSVLKCILSRKIPHIIVLDLRPDEFVTTEKSYETLSELLPYYFSNKEVQPMVDKRGSYEKIKVFSDLYRYNSLIFTIMINNAIEKKDSSIKGYCPLYKTWNQPLTSVDELKKDDLLDAFKIKTFKDLILEAKKAGTVIFVCVSPLFEKSNHETKTISIAGKFCADNGVSFFDFSRSSFFWGKPEYFQDVFHLNNKGAIAYSRLVSTIIKKQLYNTGAENKSD